MIKVRKLLKKIIEVTGYTLIKKASPIPSGTPDTYYDQDGLRTNHNHEFILDSSFTEAYNRACKAQGSMKSAARDIFYNDPREPEYHWHWRVHIGLWVALQASMLNGDFVECGVNRGMLSSGIMNYLNWDSLGKNFYLIDTFNGIDQSLLTDTEKENGYLEKNEQLLSSGFYVSGIESVKENFSEWENITIVEGSIPQILNNLDLRKVAYLHIDMNNVVPEMAALEFFWDRLVPGAFILMDDYAYNGYRNQKLGMDEVAMKKGVKIASLPTGQGLLIKPPEKYSSSVTNYE